MNQSTIAGIAAGSCAALWVSVHSTLFPSHPWGSLPLLLAFLPFVATLMYGRPLVLRLSDRTFLRWLPAAAALFLPLLFLLFYELTGAFSFIANSYNVFSLLPLLLIYAVFAALTLDTLTQRLRSRPDSAYILSGVAVGFILISLATTILPTVLLWLLQAVPFFFLEMKTLPSEQNEQPVSIPSKNKKRNRSPRLPDFSRYAFYLLVAAGSFGAAVLLRTYSGMPYVTSDISVINFGFLFLSTGLGLLSGRKLLHRFSNNPASYAFVAAAAVLVIASAIYTNTGFPSLYIDYYEGAASSGWKLLFPLLLIHLPLVLAAAATATTIYRKPARKKTDSTFSLYLLTTLSFVIGLLTYTLLPDTFHWQEAARGISIVLALCALLQVIRWSLPRFLTYIPAALAIAVAAFAAFLPPLGFYSFLNPTQFKVTDEQPTFAGTMTLLHSRDYDDPFYALLWRSIQPLTQSSRMVQSALYKMGHIPMMLGPEHARVLMFGLASTVPVQTVLKYEPAQVTCVEPFGPTIPLSRQTSRDKRPRPWLQQVVFHAERIESYVRRSDETFDIIISAEPFAVPGNAGPIFTPSTMRHTASMLSDSGVFAQWLPLSRVGENGLRSVAAAIADAFPYIELWISSPDPENAMAGIVAFKNKPASGLPTTRLLESLLADAETAFHFRQIEIVHWVDLASCWCMDDGDLRAFASGAEAPGLFSPLAFHSTDNNPEKTWTEIRSLLKRRSSVAKMHAAISDSVAAAVEQSFAEALVVFDARILSLQDEDKESAKILADLVRSSPGNTEAKSALGALFLRQAAGYVGEQQYPQAVGLLNSTMSLVPVNTYLLRLLMICAFQIGDRETSAISIDGIRKIDPLHAGFRDNQATIRAQEGATDDALLLYENAISLDASNEDFYCNMASFHYSQQRVWEAVRVLDLAIIRAYYPAKALYLQGVFYSEHGRYDLAKTSFEEYFHIATPLDPLREEVENRLDGLPQ